MAVVGDYLRATVLSYGLNAPYADAGNLGLIAGLPNGLILVLARLTKDLMTHSGRIIDNVLSVPAMVNGLII